MVRGCGHVPGHGRGGHGSDHDIRGLGSWLGCGRDHVRGHVCGYGRGHGRRLCRDHDHDYDHNQGAHNFSV